MLVARIALVSIDLAGDDWAPRSLIDGFDAEWTVIGLHADMWAFAAHWTGLEVGQAEGDQIEF